MRENPEQIVLYDRTTYWKDGATVEYKGGQLLLRMGIYFSKGQLSAALQEELFDRIPLNDNEIQEALAQYCNKYSKPPTNLWYILLIVPSPLVDPDSLEKGTPAQIMYWRRWLLVQRYEPGDERACDQIEIGGLREYSNFEYVPGTEFIFLYLGEGVYGLECEYDPENK